MQISRGKYKVIKECIDSWQRDGVIDSAQAEHLLKNLKIELFDWQRLAKWSSGIAVICLLSSFGSLLSDEWFKSIIDLIYRTSEVAKALTLAAISGVFYFLGLKKRKDKPYRIYTNESLLFTGVIFTGMAIQRLGILFDTGSGHFSLLLLFATIVYGLLGIAFKSVLIWVFALISFGSWLGAETGYLSGWGMYYFGMSYPVRFALLGVIMSFAAFELRRYPLLSLFHQSTLIVGLLYLFMALWILSIFGDYTSMERWKEVKQIELFHWSLLFGLVAIISIVHGLKFDNSISRNFGMTFLLINLYTRYFEFFWNTIDKTIFFAILAVSFWFIATRAEKIYNLRIFDVGVKKGNKSS